MSENIMYKNIADKMKAQQERIEYLERSNDRREDTILGLRQEIAEQEDYKSRCEKANNFIEENWISYIDSKDFKEFDEVLEIFIKEINMLYNILKGKE